ncbi:MAG: DUF4386 family protein [Chloroherpetonaceae bacterium]|nr:DUF4386 family protein [Chloroherpetonaceae bacterium]
MTLVTKSKITGIFFIFFSLILFAGFTMLEIEFSYPDILRKGAKETLKVYHQNEFKIQLWWYLMTMGSIAFTFGTLLFQSILNERGIKNWEFLSGIGLLSGLFNTLGFMRWVFLVPMLAKEYMMPMVTETKQESIEILFEAFHTYFGFSIGEHLGFLTLGVYGIVFANKIRSGEFDFLPKWMSWPAYLGAIGTLIGILEAFGIEWASISVQLGSTVFILWMLGVGVFLMLVKEENSELEKSRVQNKVPRALMVSFILLSSFLFNEKSFAQTESQSSTEENAYIPDRELGFNFFRNPSIGAEYRISAISFHIGFYPTIISTNSENENESTTFIRVGITGWLPVTSDRKFALYSGISYVFGLSKQYEGESGFMFETGTRYFLWKGLNVRLGASVLVAPGHQPKLRPNPGVGYSFFF